MVNCVRCKKAIVLRQPCVEEYKAVFFAWTPTVFNETPKKNSELYHVECWKKRKKISDATDLYPLDVEFDRMVNKILHNKNSDLSQRDVDKMKKDVLKIQKKLLVAKKEYNRISLRVRSMDQMISAVKKD